MTAVVRWVIAGVVTLLLVWSVGVEPRWLEVTGLRIRSDATPYRTIAVIADLHPTRGDSLEREVIERLRERSPELIVLAGDMVDDPEDLEVLRDFLTQLPPAEKVAVLGNWEYWSGIDRQQLAELYAEYDVSLLVDDCYRGIVGLDDFTAGRPALAKALSQCYKATPWLLVQHSPGFFESVDVSLGSVQFDLLVSGHTHGGQISLFGWAPYTPEGSGRFVSGEYPTPLGKLYVMRGLGTSVMPIRFGARPELLIVTVVDEHLPRN
jgi:hypothetical protein